MCRGLVNKIMVFILTILHLQCCGSLCLAHLLLPLTLFPSWTAFWLTPNLLSPNVFKSRLCLWGKTWYWVLLHELPFFVAPPSFRFSSITQSMSYYHDSRTLCLNKVIDLLMHNLYADIIYMYMYNQNYGQVDVY